jgi:hypothetical protein
MHDDTALRDNGLKLWQCISHIDDPHDGPACTGMLLLKQSLCISNHILFGNKLWGS